mgnify:CR=1 FL=1
MNAALRTGEVGLVELALQVQVAVSAEVIVDAFNFAELVPHLVADQVLHTGRQRFKAPFDVLAKAICCQQQFHVQFHGLSQSLEF